MRFLLFLILGLSLSFAEAAPQYQESLFEPGTHCVGYRTGNRMVVVKVTVVGKNCEISTQVTPQLGGSYVIEIRIPIKGFKSGEAQRDTDVVKILKADVQSDLLFVSKSLKEEEWKKMAQQEILEIPGDMTIANKSYPLSVVVKKVKNGDEIEFDGSIQTKFSHFEISPPKLAAGVIASVTDDLELHFHIQASRTLGLDSLLE